MRLLLYNYLLACLFAYLFYNLCMFKLSVCFCLFDLFHSSNNSSFLSVLVFILFFLTVSFATFIYLDYPFLAHSCAHAQAMKEYRGVKCRREW